MAIFGTSTHIKNEKQLDNFGDDDYLHLKKNFWGQEKLIAIKKGSFRDRLQDLRARFRSDSNQKRYNERVVNGIVKLFANNDSKKSIGEQLNTNSSNKGSLKITVGYLKNILNDNPKITEERYITKNEELNQYFQDVGYERELDKASGVDNLFSGIKDQETQELLIRFAKVLESLSSKDKNIKNYDALLKGFFDKLEEDTKDYTRLLKSQFELKCLEFIKNLLSESELPAEKTLQEIQELKEFLLTKPTS